MTGTRARTSGGLCLMRHTGDRPSTNDRRAPMIGGRTPANDLVETRCLIEACLRRGARNSVFNLSTRQVDRRDTLVPALQGVVMVQMVR